MSTYSSGVGIYGCLFGSAVVLQVIPGVGVKSTVATVVVGVTVNQVLFAAIAQNYVSIDGHTSITRCFKCRLILYTLSYYLNVPNEVFLLMNLCKYLPQCHRSALTFASAEFERSNGGKGPTASTAALVSDGLKAVIGTVIHLYHFNFNFQYLAFHFKRPRLASVIFLLTEEGRYLV